LGRTSVECVRQSVDDGGGEGQHFGEVAQRAARLVGDGVGDHRRVLCPIRLVDITDYIVAAVGGEVDVNVQRCEFVFTQKSLEKQVVLERVDG
jgi:hypothetical protein